MLKVLIIGNVWPEPSTTAAGSRMLQLIHTFLEHNFSLTFVSAAEKSNNSYPLQELGVVCETIKLNHSSFDDFIVDLNPDIVLFDRFITEEQFGWRVTEHCPNALKILDTEDLHCLRMGRHKAIKQKKEFNLKSLFKLDITKREIASIYRCDLSLIISEEEYNILVNHFSVPKSLLLYLPFLLNTENLNINTVPKFNQREGFITIGNFLHAPNTDAILYLKNTIWPLIKAQLPKATLSVYGAYKTQKINSLHSVKEGFLIKGWAESVHTVMQQYRVCLVPLRFGAGLKGKLIDAMINGTPCVTTPIGAEGMFGTLTPNGIVTQTDKEFAAAAVKLYTNKPLWSEAQVNGYTILKERFTKKVHAKNLINATTKLLNNLPEHRTQNFIGAMLQHHNHKSTMYLAKWIETKNKLSK